MSDSTPAIRVEPSAATLEKVIVGGDLAGLSPAQRVEWYRTRCDAAGLDPRTQPFQYLQLNGKLQLYATKTATDQLINNRRLTVEVTERRHDADLGVYEVRCRVTFPDCHHVEDVAAVSVSRLSGEALCNALMKCVTKAKRRTVLSACGLGMLDESEVESISEARVEPMPRSAEKPLPPPRTEPRVLTAPSRQYSEPVLPPSDLRRWIQDEITKQNDLWRNQCLIDQVDYKPLASSFQVANALISTWIADQVLEEERVLTDGKRDKVKIGDVMREAWSQDAGEFQDDVRAYLKAKLVERAAEAGVELAEDGETVAAVAATTALPEPEWQEGRE